MMAEELRLFLKKKVKIFTKNKRIFSGSIEEVFENTIKLNDKFGEIVLISNDSIENIQSLNGGAWHEKEKKSELLRT